tara:strand:- start:744 stop:1142 length:399 start_codon:yes stop_codon:yes gene_type:complete
MGYKTRRSIIQGSKYHKDLELAYGLDGSAMPDGRPKHSAFQKKELTPGLEKAIDGGMPEKVVEDMGYDTSALPKYGPYKSEHVKEDKKQDNLVDVTKEFKTKGNQETRKHIADGGQVFKDSVTGQVILRRDA